MFRRKFDDVARGTNHDLTFEWQLLRDRGPKSGFAHIFTHHERADRAGVYDAEVCQVFGKRYWSTQVRSADVHSAKKYNPGHVRSDQCEVSSDQLTTEHLHSRARTFHR